MGNFQSLSLPPVMQSLRYCKTKQFVKTIVQVLKTAHEEGEHKIIQMGIL